MKKIVLVCLMVCLVLSFTGAKANTSSMVAVGDTMMVLSDIISKGLPVLYIQTVDSEEPTCDYVSAPAGCMGKTIANATKVPGRMVIYQHIDEVDSVLYDSGDYEKDVSGMTIRIRGNSSAYGTKKPYKIKLQKKKDLLFRGDEETYKDKDWLLLKYDYLLAMAGFKVNAMLGFPWTPNLHFVSVVLNDKYKGLYMLCESVKRNPDCRINVDKNSGYIFECDPYWWNEEVYVNSITSPSYNFTFKYPESDEILPEQLEYIQTVVTDYENSLNGPDYTDKIDIVSFAAWCLGHDIEGTKDSGGANRYYSKYDETDTSKIRMVLLWDFDMAERTIGAWSNSHTKHFQSLFDNENRTFVDEYVGLWRKMKKTFYSTISQFLNSWCSSNDGRALDASLELEGIAGGYAPTGLDEHLADRIFWYNSRYRWLNRRIDALNPIGDTDIDGVVNISDVTYLVDVLLGGARAYRYADDVNGDGSISIYDLSDLIDMMLTQTSGPKD